MKLTTVRWIVGLALYVAAEKLIPAGNWLSRLTGILLIGWGRGRSIVHSVGKL